MKEDLVNNPPHYTSHPSGIEAIEITRHMNFNLGNAMKYLWRAGLKDSSKTIEDLRKAIFYIEDEVTKLQEEECFCRNCCHTEIEARGVCLNCYQNGCDKEDGSCD